MGWLYLLVPTLVIYLVVRQVLIERWARHRQGAAQVLEQAWVLEPQVPLIDQSPLGGLNSDDQAVLEILLEGGYTSEQTQRALFALDAIRLGVEGRLGLKAQMLSSYGVTTVTSDLAYFPGDRKIVRAAKKALTGQVRPKVNR